MSKLLIRGASLIRARDEQRNSSTMIDLLIVLVGLIIITLLLTGVLYLVRSIRRQRAITRQALLPTHHNRSSSNVHHRLNISTPYSRGSTISVYDEKTAMINKPTTPNSPESIPEIRITFPDEQDESGRRKSGRVVVVRIGDTGIGLEPLSHKEQLPAYETETGCRFHSIDMERIGGLKEKTNWS
ncbi:hypothetical protein K3495_g7744 [Podosphaera aphanis]|nr:hypothetical protein K3495_g7744 [Podosphaera aphanis]